MTEQHQTPCGSCPFRRTVTPGELGGSPVETYVGQTEAGFLIQCHECIDYEDPDWKAKVSVPGAVHQCAGASIFRSNIGRPNPAILTLPPDTETVFGSHEQFVAHHKQVDLLDGSFPRAYIAACVDRELHRAGVVLTLVPKPENDR